MMNAKQPATTGKVKISLSAFRGVRSVMPIRENGTEQ